jgi:hypothetical protein
MVYTSTGLKGTFFMEPKGYETRVKPISKKYPKLNPKKHADCSSTCHLAQGRLGDAQGELMQFQQLWELHIPHGCEAQVQTLAALLSGNQIWHMAGKPPQNGHVSRKILCNIGNHQDFPLPCLTRGRY